MIEPNHATVSLARPCRLVSMARSTLYYEARGESEERLELMRRLVIFRPLPRTPAFVVLHAELPSTRRGPCLRGAPRTPG